ncbi:MAG: APC family permease [Vicinamibacteria bacterium]
MTGTGDVPVHIPKARRLGLTALTCVIFGTACGGPFGLEALVGSVGAGWAFVLILLTPLLWALPTSLAVAELAGLMPEEGGYYVWVRETLGPFWGLQEAWWTLGYSIVLMAIYPVLFVNYLTYLVPSIGSASDIPGGWPEGLTRWLLAVLVILSATAVNWRGAKAVGRYAELSMALVLGAFAILVLAGLGRPGGLRAATLAIAGSLDPGRKGALLVGLSVVIFNYSGWDNASTFAGEVNEPRRNYPRALAIALVTTVLVYVLPLLAGLSVTTDAAAWSAEAGWPVIARGIGGPRMGSLLAAAGLVATWSLFSNSLLYVSRLPYVMACDGWLPHRMAKASGEAGVPKVALAWSCVITAVFAAVSFGDLVVMYVALYGLALALEFLALIVMRVRKPEAIRTFAVPGGWLGIAYVCLAPFSVAAAVLLASLREEQSHAGQFLVVAGILLSGAALYLARRPRA